MKGSSFDASSFYTAPSDVLDARQRGLGPNGQFVADMRYVYRSTMRLWHFFRTIPGTLPVYKAAIGRVATCEVDFCVDVERLVDRYLGSHILWLYTNTPEELTIEDEVILGIAFTKAKLAQHYQSLFANRKTKRDIGDLQAQQETKAAEELLTGALEQDLEEVSVEPQEFAQSSDEPATVSWFAE